MRVISPARGVTALAVALILLLVSAEASANETTLFDSQGNATAYFVQRSLTIFLWNGTPVAYLQPKSWGADYAVYGFNGDHLGWLDDGVVRDHDGYAVGFVKGAVTNVLTRIEPIKRLKRLEPLRGLRRLEPLQPLFRNSFSRVPLEDFLLRGAR